MDNFLVILAVGGLGVVAAFVGAFLSSETVHSEGLMGAFRRLHWKISATERYRRPYGS
ncbi:hypothetical protein [Phenylobacterium sp.]|uniref:hypothetical protein n=1 Tax=Phenylobacterium sp. TaxID=1871053 RepID=UPI0025E5994F|nr:hypothetical protein [Phenylobacterium sp.]